MREKDIIHENGKVWVSDERKYYTVFVAGATHSISESSYTHDADGLSIAKARCDYLAQRDVAKIFTALETGLRKERHVQG